jgi:hypothetical protein
MLLGNAVILCQLLIMPESFGRDHRGGRRKGDHDKLDVDVRPLTIGGKIVICPRCGAENVEMAESCSSCGMLFVADDSEADWNWGEYLDIWRRTTFGTPPGAYGLFVKVLVWIMVPILIVSLLVLSYTILRSGPSTLTTYAYTAVPCAIAVMIAIGCVVLAFRTRQSDESEDEEGEELVSESRGPEELKRE